MGLLTFSINVTLDGCVDHQEGIADDETHAFFTGLMDEGGAMLWGRVTYEMLESYWPAVARGDEEAPPAMREWAVKLEAKPKYVVSSTRKDFPWTNSHHIAGDLRTGVQKLRLDAMLGRSPLDAPEVGEDEAPAPNLWLDDEPGASPDRPRTRHKGSHKGSYKGSSAQNPGTERPDLSSDRAESDEFGTAYRIPGKTSHASQSHAPGTARRHMRRMRPDR
jgi:hypothetical protein